MFGRESLRELVRNLHEESLQFQCESREKYEELLEETREFNREILLRNEKVYTSLLAGHEKATASVLERLEALGREIEEGRLQIKANTEAVLRMLDRFDEPGGAAA